MANLRSYEYNALCPVCAFKVEASSMLKRWDGQTVCKDCWEPRNILDFYRPRNDAHLLPYIYRDDATESSLEFNGTTSYASMPFSVARASVGASLTVQVEIFPTLLNSGRNTIMSTRTNASPAGSWSLQVGQASGSGASKGTGRIAFATPGIFNFESNDGVIPLNRWSKVTYSRNSTGNQVVMVNGSLISARTGADDTLNPYSFVSTITNLDSWTIGSKDGTVEFFKGRIRNLRLWNKMLTVDEMFRGESVINSTSDFASGLQGWWYMNDGTGSTLVDQNSATTNMTVTNTTWVNYL